MRDASTRSPLKRMPLAAAIAIAVGTATGGSPVAAQTHGQQPDHFQIAVPPAWVETISVDVDTPAPAELSGGMYLRLVDEQVHLSRAERYFRYADEFVNTAGLEENAEITIEFDPAYQTLTLHEVRLHRDGEVVDVLDLANDLDLLRVRDAEDELDEKLLSGQRMLLLPVPDARVGDVLDYSFTIRGENPFFAGGFFADRIELERNEAVHLFRYRLIKTHRQALFWKNHRCERKPTTSTRADGLDEFVWQVSDSPAVLVEADTPAWYQPYAFVQLTSFATWNEVARHSIPFYGFSEPFPEDLEKVIAEIAGRHATSEARALAAARLVQNDIRYLGLVGGAAAYCPEPPSLTWTRRFGDCKNNTTLLMHILRKLGIDSTPVYVDIDGAPRGFDWLPTPSAEVFDHVILNLHLPDNNEVWVDTTISHQGGALRSTDPGNYRIGLPLDVAATNPVPIGTAPEHGNPALEHVTETYFLGDVGQPSRLEVETIYRGSDSTDMRLLLETTHPSRLGQSLAASYRENFPRLTVGSAPQIDDDFENDRLSVSESYLIDGIWERDAAGDGYHSVFFYFDGIRRALKMPQEPLRTAPFDIGTPRHQTHTTVVHLPESEDWQFEDEVHFIEEAGLRFERSVAQENKTLTIETSLSNREDHVVAEKMADYAAAINDMTSLSHYSIWRLVAGDATATAAQNNPRIERNDRDAESAFSHSQNRTSRLLDAATGFSAAVLLLGGGLLFRRGRGRGRRKPNGRAES